MKTYNLYVKNDKKNLGEVTDIIAIDEGFNWWCLLFGIFWAVFKQVWNLVLAYLILFIAFYFLTKFAILSTTAATIAKFFIAIVFAFNANDLYGKALVARGYLYKGIVVGKDREQALMRFCEKIS